VNHKSIYSNDADSRAVDSNDNANIRTSITEGERYSHVGRMADALTLEACHSTLTNLDDARIRHIQPQLAKPFHAKPAAGAICFTVDKRRARREIASLLQEWKRYGMRDIIVDKERNAIFARVDARNCKSLLFTHHLLLPFPPLLLEGRC
jgi:hypothetical protein